MMAHLLFVTLISFASIAGGAQEPSDLVRGCEQNLRTVFLAKEPQEPLRRLSLELEAYCQRYPEHAEIRYLYIRALELLADHPRWQGPPNWRTEAAKAALLFPNSSRIRTVAARADGTVATARMAFDLDPSYGPARITLAKALLHSGHAQDARILMEAAQGLDNLPKGWLTLAQARFESGDLPGALKAAKAQLKTKALPTPEPSPNLSDERSQTQSLLRQIRKVMNQPTKPAR